MTDETTTEGSSRLTASERLDLVPNRLTADGALELRASGEFPPVHISAGLLINQLPVVTYINDGRGCCVFISPQIESLFGYTPEEILSQPFLFPNCIHPNDKETAFETHPMLEERDEFDVDFRLITRSGAVRWVRDRGRMIRDENGEVIYQQGFMYDITSEREMAAREQQAQKLDLAGRIAGGIAHDFNSVLMSVFGLSEVVLEKMAEDDPNRGELEALHESAKTAIELSKRLLAFAGKQARHIEQIDINAVITEAVEIVSPLMPRGVIETVLAQDICLVKADRSQILQVILNLLMNARDAVEGKGKIQITTEDDLDRRSIRLTIEDDGGGINPDHLQRIFEPFFTTKQEGEGTGLGLSTVQSIVQQYHGAIEVESSSEGSRFVVELPCLTERASGASTDDSAPDGSGRTVLLVEDEAGVRMLVSSLLAKHGFAVIEAEDGEDALDKLAAHEGAITFVLTDVVMPRLGGVALAERMTESHPDVPVMFMSGHTTDPALDERIAAGALFIEKPFSNKDLVRVLAEVVERRQHPAG